MSFYDSPPYSTADRRVQAAFDELQSSYNHVSSPRLFRWHEYAPALAHAHREMLLLHVQSVVEAVQAEHAKWNEWQRFTLKGLFDSLEESRRNTPTRIINQIIQKCFSLLVPGAKWKVTGSHSTSVSAKVEPFDDLQVCLCAVSLLESGFYSWQIKAQGIRVDMRQVYPGNEHFSYRTYEETTGNTDNDLSWPGWIYHEVRAFAQEKIDAQKKRDSAKRAPLRSHYEAPSPRQYRQDDDWAIVDRGTIVEVFPPGADTTSPSSAILLSYPALTGNRRLATSPLDPSNREVEAKDFTKGALMGTPQRLPRPREVINKYLLEFGFDPIPDNARILVQAVPRSGSRPARYVMESTTESINQVCQPSLPSGDWQAIASGLSDGSLSVYQAACNIRDIDMLLLFVVEMCKVYVRAHVDLGLPDRAVTRDQARLLNEYLDTVLVLAHKGVTGKDRLELKSINEAIDELNDAFSPSLTAYNIWMLLATIHHKTRYNLMAVAHEVDRQMQAIDSPMDYAFFQDHMASFMGSLSAFGSRGVDLLVRDLSDESFDSGLIFHRIENPQRGRRRRKRKRL